MQSRPRATACPPLRPRPSISRSRIGKSVLRRIAAVGLNCRAICKRTARLRATLVDWRRWHHTGDKARRPPTRGWLLWFVCAFSHHTGSLIKDVERTGTCFKLEQVDDMMWLTMSQRAWRIIAVEDKMLLLESYFGEQTQVDLAVARQVGKILAEKAAEALSAAR